LLRERQRHQDSGPLKMTNDTPHSPPPPLPPLPPARPRRGRYLLLAAGAVAIAVAALGWLVGSEGGLRLLCSSLAQISGGRLQIEAPGGRLLGDWHARSLRWHDASSDVEVQQLSVNWSPRELLHGRLLLERVAAASVRIFSAPSAEPATPPQSLRLPLAVRVEQLTLGRLLLGEAGGASDNAATLAEAIDAVLDSDGRTHRLERLQARLGQLDLAAAATLAGDQSLALTAHAELKGSALEQPFALQLSGGGPLERLQIDGKIVAGASASKPPVASGDVQALLTPFAAQPIAALDLQLRGIDPALLVKDVPQALLDVDARLASRPAAAGESAASGSLRVSNRRSGALDRKLLPVDSLQAQVDWQGGRLVFDGLVLALAGGGRLAGQGSFADGRGELKLVAQGVNARALHGRLLPTRLAGPVHAEFGGDSQTLEVDLRDARYAVNARASVTPQAVEVSRLQLATGDARLSAHGQLALAGEQRFSAHGRLQNFDPARFMQTKGLPRSVLNADLEASGALDPALELALHFDLRDSRVGVQRIGGKGDVDLRGARLRKLDVDLDAAGNRLTALGAFGQAGDTLRLKLLAPRLESLGWAAMAGDATANLVVGGSLASPEFSGEWQSNRLRLASLLDVKGLSLDAQLAAGAQGKLAGLLRCIACALPDYGIAPLALELKLDGVRRQHRLDGLVGLPEKRQLLFVVDGGLAEESTRAAGSAPPESWTSWTSWAGTLEQLRLGKASPADGKPLLELAAAAPLRLGATATSFGPATFGGLIGSLRVERLAHEQGSWQSAGCWQQFRPQAVLAEFPALQARLAAVDKGNPQPVVLGGEWEFTLADQPGALPAGRAALWRESGDVQLGGVLLGLGEARLQASVGEGRVAASAQLRGARLGEISGELTAASARRADGGMAALVDAQAPWQGRLQAGVPDLAWLGPLLGESWQVAGRLNGEMRLAGSAARPQFTGEWRGENLALRALDQGMRLERGNALIEITPERLLLRRLTFDSDFQPLPRVLRLDPEVDAARLIGTPGRVEASGELALAGAAAGSDARLSFRLDRVGVVQRPEQWVAVSGDGEVRVGERVLDVGGKLRIDAGLWSLAETGRPTLSDDVVIRQARSDAGPSSVPRALRLDLQAVLGRSVHFRGVGVESRLEGQLRIRSDDAGLPRASGSIRTVDGRFDAYGQKLGIERGIINFQGAIDNPGLNILAVRENLQVEAGVAVTGTAQRPIIRLVSTPQVPDAEKLSWLVLGHSPEQQSGGDSGILLAAARTILGGQDGGVLSQLQRGLGIDEFGVSSGQIGGYTSLPTSRVASSTGFGGSQTVNGQIVSVGKRLSSNAVLSYEQSLSTTESIVKLTVQLGRQFSVVGRAGSESALDFFWNRSFGK
jgi:translocation and assembly module TamB